MRAAGIEDVNAAVTAYAAEVTAHAKQEKAVKDHEGKKMPSRPIWNDFAGKTDPAAEFAKAQEKYEAAVAARPTPYPAPFAHPDIMSAVGPDGKPNYEIINDLPTPKDILIEKKTRLFGQVSLAETEAIHNIVPPGKRRLFNIQVEEVRKTDAERSEEMVRKINSEESEKTREKMIAELNSPDFHKKARSKQDKATMSAHDDRTKKIDAIILWAATLHAEIEDLTLDNIDTWTLTPYSG